MRPGFPNPRRHLSIHRTIQRKLRFVALCLFCLTFAVTIASTLSHKEVSDSQTANDTPSGKMSSSSQDARIAIRENERSVKRGTRIHSNQHGLISVSIHVEIEDYTTIPIPLSHDKDYRSYTTKDREGGALKVASVFPPQNVSNIIWTVSVEEVKVGGSDAEKDESNSISTPYSQRVFLEWGKRKEANENSQDTANANIPDSKSFHRNSIYYLGSANCTFMIPLNRDDSSMQAQAVQVSSSSSLTRTFIVSLMQSTQRAANMNETSLTYYSQNYRQHTLGSTNAVLTRRLAMLPRQTHSHQTVDPVVDVFLNHSQQMRHKEKPEFSKSSSFEEQYSASEEDTRSSSDTGDYINKESARTSKNDLRNVSNDFLWTLLLLCIVYLIQSTPTQFAMSCLYHSGYVKSIPSVVLAAHCEKHDVEDSQEDTNNHDELEEDVGNKGSQYQKKHHHCNPQSVKAGRRKDEVQVVPHLQLDYSVCEENDTIISAKARKCLGKGYQRREQRESFENNEGDRNSSDETIEKEIRNKKESLGNPKTTHEEAALEDESGRLRTNTELTNNDTCRLRDNFSNASTLELRNMDATSGSSAEIAVLSTIRNQNNSSVLMKSRITSTTGFSFKSGSNPQIPEEDKDRKEKKLSGENDIHGMPIDTKQSNTNLDLPLKHSPRGTVYITNSTGKREVPDYSRLKGIPRGDRKYTGTCSNSRNDRGRHSSSKEIEREAGCNNSPPAIEKPYMNLLASLGSPSEVSIMADKYMHCVNSMRNSVNSGTGVLNEDGKAIHNSQLKDCPPRTSLLTGKRLVERPMVTLAKRFQIGSNDNNNLHPTSDDHTSRLMHRKSPMPLDIPSQSSKSGTSEKCSSDQRFQSISRCKKIGNDEEHKIRECDETEESYVSTLPPDSDYLSEEDPTTLLSSYSRPELKPTESKFITCSSRNEREKISTNTRSRKRKKPSHCNTSPGGGVTAADSTLLSKGSEKLYKEVHKEKDLDSVELVRVTIPGGGMEKTRVKRPYSKSNYVADWVPSNELQSMSQQFLQDESWDITAVPTPLHTSSNSTVVDESMETTQSPTKKNKKHSRPSGFSIPSSQQVLLYKSKSSISRQK